MSIGECKKRAWGLLKDNTTVLVSYFGLCILFYLVLVVLSYLVNCVLLTDILAGVENGGQPNFFLIIVINMITQVIHLVFLYYSVILSYRIFRKIADNDTVNLTQEILSPFKEGWIGKAIIVEIKRIFIMSLWSLLLVVPGIIYAYKTCYASWLVTENVDMTSGEILELSKRMTKGHKGYLFVLSLSFIGWILLGIIPFGLGLLVVLPWMFLTFAVDYVERRKLVDGSQSGAVTNDTYAALDE